MKQPPFSVPFALLCLGLAALSVLFHLMPMQLSADSAVLPDVLLALLVAWSFRRPQDLPLVPVALVLLFADLALDRPTGLWALISLLILEVLGDQREPLRDRPFPAEWGAFAVALALGLIAQSLILRLAIVDRPEGNHGLHLFVRTVAVYPLVAGLLHYVFRVRAPRPAERSRRLGAVR